MDRVSSSMKQVPNPLPKVLSRRGGGGGGGLEAERESFERSQGLGLLPKVLYLLLLCLRAPVVNQGPSVLGAVQTQNKKTVSAPESLQSKYRTRHEMDRQTKGGMDNIDQCGRLWFQHTSSLTVVKN
uniref:Uncharacterized protein n=1 Tax=Gopherus agassizii TaxID=38772 RepID=A0A452IPP5_9SAUR